MSQAENLLASLTENVVEHAHSVIDSDTYFIIDHITRKIENTAHRKNTIMQYDHNSERFTFELTRYVEGHDMSLCNRVRVHYINIDGQTGESYADLVELNDLQIDPNNSDTVICSWLISRRATQFAGSLNFLVQYMCVSDLGTVDYEWHSSIYYDLDVDAGRNNGEAAVIEYTDLVEQWRAKLFNSGDSVVSEITLNAETQLSNIRTEGVNQVTAVTAEGEKQVAAVANVGEDEIAAIELKGQQTLDSIPEDYTEVNNMAEEAVRSKGDAITCEAEGAAITVADSSDDYVRGLKMFGKSSQVTTNGYQLFDASKIENAASDGVTLTNNGDGSFTVTGTVMGSSGINAKYVSTDIVEKLKVGKIYLITENILTYVYVNMKDANDNSILTLGSAEGYVQEADITAEKLAKISSVTYGFYGQAGKTVTAGTTKPMLYQDGDGTWEPYTGGMPAPNPDYPQEIESAENITICVCGKNLLDVSQLLNKNLTENNGAYTLTRNESGERFSEIAPIHIPANTPFRVSLKIIDSTNSSGRLPLYFKSETGTTYYASLSTEYSCLYNENITSIGLYLAANEEIGSYITFSDMQIEIGDVTTRYEPYKPIQSVTITQSLPGIPVASGGNYTDPDGQQWICDEIDFERGVYVERVKKIVLDGSDKFDIAKNHDNADRYLYTVYSLGINTAIDGRGYCSALQYNTANDMNAPGANTIETSGYSLSNSYSVLYLNMGYLMTENSVEALRELLAANPITFLAALKNPIETPLTAEEIAAFKSLRTNCPNTTILNDAGAWMSVKYNADTKTYVENPKTLKLVDSSTGVVYELKIVDGNLTVVPV